MTKFTIEKIYNSNFNNTKEIFTDFKNYDKFFPYFKKSKILSIESNNVITEEIFDTQRKNLQITQRAHYKIFDKSIQNKILSGPLAGSISNFNFESLKNNTKLIVNVDLKFNTKFRIFSFFLKKKFQFFLNLGLEFIDKLLLLTSGQSWNQSLTNDSQCLIISKNGFAGTKLFNWWKSEIVDVFFYEIYDFLPVNEKIVLDIGANICDSSIYFAKKHAKKIIAVEPFIKNIEIGKKNIEKNNLNSKIELLHTACLDKISTITLNDTYEGAGLHLENSLNGTKIETITLDKLVTDFKLSSAILKMDCEDCEYPSIISSKNSTLNSFSHVLIEYHHGYKKLMEKFQSNNFNVKVEPIGKTKKKDYGYLYCTNRKNI